MEAPTLAAIGSLIGGLGGLMGSSKGGGGEQPAQAPAAAEPPASQAAKTPTVATFEKQNAQAEGPMSGSPGSTLLTGGGLGAGTLGKAKTLGGMA